MREKKVPWGGEKESRYGELGYMFFFCLPRALMFLTRPPRGFVSLRSRDGVWGDLVTRVRIKERRWVRRWGFSRIQTHTHTDTYSYTLTFTKNRICESMSPRHG